MPYISCCSKHYVAYTPHTRALRADWVWPVGKHDDHAIESIEVSLQCASRKYKERWWYVFNRKIEMNKNKQESKKRCGCFRVEVFFFFFLFCFWFVYPHALKASQSPQRSQRSQSSHRFERLNLAATKKRGHIIHQRDLNTHTTRTQLPLRLWVFFFFFFFFCCCRFLFGGVSFFKQQDRYLSVWHPVVNGCLHGTNNWMTRDQTQKEKKKKRHTRTPPTHIEEWQSRSQDIKCKER